MIRKCLVKDADDRAASARGLMLDLQWIAAGGAESPVEAIPALPRASLFTALALGVLVGAGAVGLAVWSLGGDASVGPTRLSIRIPDDHRLDFNKELAFSPDGRDLVYVAAEDGVRRLYRRSLSAQAPVPLSGTEGARAPFFSPDGEWIGFFDGTALKRVALDGGQSVTVTAILADMPSGASWGVDDTILFSVFGGQGIVKVPAGGGEPEILVEGAVRPDHVPGSDAVLFERDHQILVRAMRTGEERVLIEGDGPRYVAGGHIAFYREGSLWAVPFDAKRLRLAGPAVELRADLYQRESQASLAYEVSRGGYLAFTPPGTDNVTQLVWLDREGEETEAFRQTGSFLNPELSPDGARVAVAKLDPESENRDIWIIDFRRNLSSRFTFDPASDFSSVWSPGGERIVFNSRRSGVFNLHTKLATGTGGVERLLEAETHNAPLDWTSDGRFLIYLTYPGGNRDVAVIPMQEGGEPVIFLGSEFEEYQAQLSPNDRWLAYVSTESGRDEIYVQTFPDGASKWQISTAGGVSPRWSQSSGELFFVAPDSKLVAVAVRGEDEPEFGTPEVLFEIDLYDGATPRPGIRAQYDVSPDGKRFLVNRPTGSSGGGEIRIILDWSEELERLVPTEN